MSHPHGILASLRLTEETIIRMEEELPKLRLRVEALKALLDTYESDS